MLLRLYIYLLVVFALFNPIWANTQAAHWQDKQYIEHSFYDIALRAEYQPVAPVVKKWQQPLRVWMHSNAGDVQEQAHLLKSHLQQLHNITGLPVHFVKSKAQANVRVFFVDEQDASEITTQEIHATAAQYLEESHCLGHIRFNHQAEITRGTVIIPVQRAQAQDKLQPCVVEEMTQMLGLVNDSQQVYPTVFSDITPEEQLTGLDYLLLKLLYDPNIKTGMTYQQIAPLIRQRLNAWEQTGLIAQAQRLWQPMGIAR